MKIHFRRRKATKGSWTPRVYGALLVAATCGVVAAVIWAPSVLVEIDTQTPLPKGVLPLTEAERLTAIAATRQHILWAAGGMIAIVTLIFTWSRDQVARRRADLDRDANFTSRYTEAIAQLGAEERSIQLGGIYALERIATDSPRDFQTILDVLTAHVRANSPLAPQGEQQPPLSEALLAAITVIGRLTRLDNRAARPIDLANTSLMGASLVAARLAEANLYGAELTGADLRGAFLREATLTRATVIDVRLDYAILEKASLWGVIATDAYFDSAILREADLGQAQLIGTQLRGADLTNASLTGANMVDANLVGAILTGADLTKTNLLHVAREGVDFTGADLTGADHGDDSTSV